MIVPLAFFFAMSELIEHDLTPSGEINLKTIVSEAFNALGGPEEFGKQLGRRFQSLAAEDMSQYTTRDREKMEKLFLQWSKHLTEMVKDKDKMEVEAGITNLSEEEQQAILAPLVMQWLKDGNPIGKLVLANLKQEDPEYFYAMIAEEAQQLIGQDGSESSED